MRQTEGKANWMAKAKWIAAALLLAAAAEAQEQRPKRLLLVSVPDRKLALIENGEILKIYPIAVGAAHSPSPTGEFAIVNRVVRPTYYHPGTVIAPGPKNPLGSRWIGLSLKGYGIHGTNAPKSIGKAASHGCIRMAKADLEDLFERVRVGDAVEIHGETDTLTASVFGTPDVALQTAAGGE